MHDNTQVFRAFTKVRCDDLSGGYERRSYVPLAQLTHSNANIQETTDQKNLFVAADSLLNDLIIGD